MKATTPLTALALAALLFTACDDTSVEAPATVLDEPTIGLNDDVVTTYDNVQSTDRIEQTESDLADRANAPTNASTTDADYEGLMPDEVRYRNSNGNVNFNALPPEEIDGLGSDWADMHRN